MLNEILKKISRFISIMSICTIASVHTLIIAVPAANRPGAIVAAIASALIIAMYDIGIFQVEIDTDQFNIH